jgi:hypothetical protein
VHRRAPSIGALARHPTSLDAQPKSAANRLVMADEMAHPRRRRVAAFRRHGIFTIELDSKCASSRRRDLTTFPYESLMTATYPVTKGDMEVQDPERDSTSNAARRL